jgi:hypothetical protein
MSKKVLTEDEVFKILKKFTLECVHGVILTKAILKKIP